MLRVVFLLSRLKSLFLLFFLLLLSGQSFAQTKVVMQLRWLHQFQFAGYYAALHKGFYKDAGLDVTLKQGGPDISATDAVLQGRANFGVSNSGLVKSYLDGQPLLVLAPIVQHSPEVLLSLGRKNGNPADIAKAGPVSLQPGYESFALKAIFVNEGIPLDKLNIATASKGLDDLLSGKIVAMNAYLTNEPFFLQQRGIPYNILNPEHYGMDFYSDVLFTSRDIEKAQPEVVAAFRLATLKGWAYALDHSDEIIDLILARYNTQGKSREQLAFEAKVLAKLISPDIIQLGHSNPERWRHIAMVYADGKPTKDFSLEGFFYDPNPLAQDMSWLYRALAAALIAIGVIAFIALYIHRINLKLQASEAQLEIRIEQETRAKNEHRKFIAMLPHELRTPLAVIDSAVQSLEHLQQPQDEETLLRYRRIRRSVGRINGLVKQFLSNDQIDDPRRLTVRQMPQDGANLARQALQSCTEGAADRVLLQTPDTVPCWGDAALMQTALVNLLDNALKYSPANNQVEFQVGAMTHQGLSGVAWTVADHGPGIAPENRKAMFDKYVRGADHGNVAGVGLGLYLVQRIAELHSGSVEILDHDGYGAVLRFWLPNKEEIICSA